MGVIRIWRRVVSIPCRGGTEQRWQHLYWDNPTNLPSPAHTHKLFKNNRSNRNRNQFPSQLKLGPQRLKLHLWVCNCSTLKSCFSPPGRWNQLPSLCLDCHVIIMRQHIPEFHATMECGVDQCKCSRFVFGICLLWVGRWYLCHIVRVGLSPEYTTCRVL